MKKLILSMLAVAVISVSAIAQKREKTDKKMPGGNRQTEKAEGFGKHHDMHNNFKNLNLSDAQKQQMKTLNESFHQQMKDLQKNENITVKEQREQREALAKQHKASIENILTPEQKAQAKEMKKDRGEKGDKMKGQGFEKATKELNLTADQSTRFKTANESFRSKAQAIRKNESLSQDQKKEQFQTLQKQHSEELNSILTKEQQEKFQQLRKNKGGRKAKI